MGPAGGVVVLVVPVVVVPVVVPVAVRFTPATPEAVVVFRFFMKYHTAAATIASRTKSQSQLSPPPVSVAGGGVVGAGVTVVWA